MCYELKIISSDGKGNSVSKTLGVSNIEEIEKLYAENKRMKDSYNKRFKPDDKINVVFRDKTVTNCIFDRATDMNMMVSYDNGSVSWFNYEDIWWAVKEDLEFVNNIKEWLKKQEYKVVYKVDITELHKIGE